MIAHEIHWIDNSHKYVSRHENGYMSFRQCYIIVHVRLNSLTIADCERWKLFTLEYQIFGLFESTYCQQYRALSCIYSIIFDVIVGAHYFFLNITMTLKPISEIPWADIVPEITKYQWDYLDISLESG